MGQEEKVAYSIPVELEEETFFVEHRKFGLGIFAYGESAEETHEALVNRIVEFLRIGVAIAAPFVEEVASRAIDRSALTINNDSPWLFDRYEYLSAEYRKKAAEAEARANETVTEEHRRSDGSVRSWTTHFPAFRLRNEARWLALAAIEAFFGWTEHVFIHIAILQGLVKTRSQFEKLAVADWQEKARTALDLSVNPIKEHYESLLGIRRQLRNFIAHGAFGKEGETFHFHSTAGAVPVMLNGPNGRYDMSGADIVNVEVAMSQIEAFIGLMWDGTLEMARLYVQEAGLPVLLPFATDGTYAEAMRSPQEMEILVHYLSRQMDDAANMD